MVALGTPLFLMKAKNYKLSCLISQISQFNSHELHAQVDGLVEHIFTERVDCFRLVFLIGWQYGPGEHIFACECFVFAEGGW